MGGQKRRFKTPAHTRSPSASPPLAASRPSTFVAPSTSKINQLPEQDRPRALAALNQTSSELGDASNQEKILRMNTVVAEGHLPRAPKPTPRAESPTLGTQMLASDAKTQGNAVRAHLSPSLSCRTVSPPLPPLYPPPLPPSDHPAPPSTNMTVGSKLQLTVPNTPTGNAWSGEHFWEPQFSPEVVPGPAEEARDWEILSAPTEPVSRAAYFSVREEVEKRSAKLFGEANEQRRALRFECDVQAAQQILAERDEAFKASESELPTPQDVADHIFDLAADENRVTSAFSIQTSSDLHDASRWMRVHPASMQVSTILDSARNAMNILKERRKNIGGEMSPEAYAVVHALTVLDEKTRKLEKFLARSDDSDNESEIGPLDLKSLREEMAEFEREKAARERGESASLVIEQNEGKTLDKGKGKAAVLPAPHHPHRLSTIGWDEIKSDDDSKGGAKGKSVAPPAPVTDPAPPTPTTPTTPSPLFDRRRRSMHAEVVVKRRRERGWSESTAISEGDEGDEEEEEVVLQPGGVGGAQSSLRSVSGGRAGDLEKRKERGMAPSVGELENWAEEMMRLEGETPLRRLEDVQEGASEGVEPVREEEIGLAITKD